MDLLHTEMSRLTANDAVQTSPMRIDWPQTACDRALGCGEIVHEILERVSREGEQPKSDLLKIALVNTFFSEFAFDVMWKTMHSLGPFLSLLPCEETTIGSAKKILMIGTPATEHRDFVKYANRLRTLTLADRCQQSDVFPMLAIERLARLQPNTPLFPNLESVIFESTEISQLQAAYTEITALSPITKVAFTRLHIETTTFVHVLTSFSFNPPAGVIRDLTIDLPEPGHYFGMGSLHYLEHLPSLCNLSITCPNIDFPIFELMDWIAGLKFLRTLKIDVRADAIAPDSVERLHSQASSVRLLSLAGPSSFICPTVPIFLDISEHIELEFIDVGSDEEGNEIESFIRSLKHTSLEVNFKEPE